MDRISPTAVENVISRAAALAYPAEPLGLLAADDATWRAALAAASRERVVEITDALSKVEAQHAAERAEAELRHEAAVLRGEAEPHPDAAAERDRILREAAAAAARVERERPQRIEALLERIARAVERG